MTELIPQVILELILALFNLNLLDLVCILRYIAFRDQLRNEDNMREVKDMEKQYQYMVKRNDKLPTLLLLEPDGKYKVHFSDSCNSERFYWVYSPEMEDILIHRDRFPEYTDISEEEAEEIKHQLEAEYARLEDEKHIINVEHSQKPTEQGIVLIDTYTKDKERPSFRRNELKKLLSDLAAKEDMTIQRIDYCFLDYWGYCKDRTSTNIEDIEAICVMPLAIDGYFMDRDTTYRFIYIDAENKVVIARCQNQSGINLQSVFDDDTNRKARGFWE